MSTGILTLDSLSVFRVFVLRIYRDGISKGGALIKLSRRTLFRSAGAGLLAFPARRLLAATQCDPSHLPSLPVRVDQPRSIKAWELPAERISVGVPKDYKPNMALLSDGRLVMVAVFEVDLPNGTYYFNTHFWQSTDGGRTWSQRRKLENVHGHESFLSCTSKGTLFLTTAMLPPDIHNKNGFYYQRLYRSTDAGRTWHGRDIILRGEARQGVSARRGGTRCSRKVVELPDGRLLLGVSVGNSPVGYIWTSSDDGMTWESSKPVKIGEYHGKPYDNSDGFFEEDFTFVNHAREFIHFIRCGPPSPMYPMDDGRVTPRRNDSGDRMMMCTSSDEGLTWSDVRDCGDYGVMYPRVIRIKDGRLLMTYTQRSLFYPIGLRAVLSEDDGDTWNWGSDQITIEGETPWGMAQGGGFGNTLQLKDGGLVSCSSYRGYDNETHIQVIRWRLEQAAG